MTVWTPVDSCRSCVKFFCHLASGELAVGEGAGPPVMEKEVSHVEVVKGKVRDLEAAMEGEEAL